MSVDDPDSDIGSVDEVFLCHKRLSLHSLPTIAPNTSKIER
jgi:hypothetical protein